MTTTVRALIAEDEPILAHALVQALGRLWPQLQVCAVVDNGESAVREALALKPEVLFFDIKMPGQTGIEAVEELAEEWPQDQPFPLVVFVTAYDEFALAAFEHAAADYVLKPISDARLGKTIERLQQRLAAKQESGTELERVLGQLRSLVPGAAPSAERLSVIRAGSTSGAEVRLIPVDDVMYFEAADKYINVVTRDSSALIRTSLRELLAQLDPARFWQVHRGTVVNISCIRVAQRDDMGKVTLQLHERKESLAVSRVFAHLFKQM